MRRVYFPLGPGNEAHSEAGGFEQIYPPENGEGSQMAKVSVLIMAAKLDRMKIMFRVPHTEGRSLCYVCFQLTAFMNL